MGVNYKCGDLVFWEMKLPWPARIVKSRFSRKSGKRFYKIFLYGWKNYIWVKSKRIIPYFPNKDSLMNSIKVAKFVFACREIEDYIKMKGIIPPESHKMEDEWLSTKSYKYGNKSKKSKISTLESTSQKMKLTSEATGSTADYLYKNSEASTSKDDNDIIAKPNIFDVSDVPIEETHELSTGKHDNDITDKPNIFDVTHVPIEESHDLRTTKDDHHIIDKLNIFDVPYVPIEDKVPKPKALRASSLIFGFLGLGTIGSRIVTTLLRSGHKVNVWSRDVEKTKYFTTMAAENYPGQIKFYNIPLQIFLNSDIIVSCLPDQHVIGNLVFGKYGVIQDLKTLNGKGYVELSSVDSDFSVKFSNMITMNGGRYLQTQMQGSKQEADDGDLVVVLAGDKDLYEDCSTFFMALTKALYFVGNVESATNVNLIFQMIKGVSLVALMDGLALADRAGLNMQQVVEIFNATNLCSDYLKGKCNMVLNSNFRNPQQPLKHMQKDLSYVLKLSESLNQPMNMASIAHEVYKHGNRLGYEFYDASAVYIGARR